MVLFLLCLGLHLPIGKSYMDTFSIPVVGSQSVKMEVLNNTHAKITLSGIIKSSGIVEFSVEEYEKLTFIVRDPLLKLMNRFRCSVSEPVFDNKKDEARLKLYIRPLFFSKNLCLKSCKSFPSRRY